MSVYPISEHKDHAVKVKNVASSKIKIMHAFFISSNFITNTRINLAKNQTNAKQHLEAELLLFGSYSHFSSYLQVIT